MHRSLVCAAGVLAALALAAAPAVAAPLTWSALTPVSPGGSPFSSTSGGAPCQTAVADGQTGTNFPGTQVEPWLAVDPANNNNQIAVWQQDRWSDGGANALLGAYSNDGGGTWTTPPISAQPKFSFCTDGSGPSGGYTRASDPWVTIAPNGDAYFMALQADIGTSLGDNAMSVSKSTDHGQTWSTPIVLKRDTSLNVLNDKNSMTADRGNSQFVYAVWDRLVFPNEQARSTAGEHAIGYRGPTWFARTTDGGASWEPARIIYDPGEVNQTIGNQIVVTGDGTLVDGFSLILNFKNTHKARGFSVAAIHSDDNGASWSGATRIAGYLPGTVRDPSTGAPVRTGDIIPEIAADPRTGSSTVYIVWQARSASGRATVMFSKSLDDGVNWSAPVAINTVLTTHAFTPSIRVGKDGAVTVTYHDFRNDTSAAPLVTNTWSLHSHDGGSNWIEDPVDGTYDMSTAAVARGYFIGDYEGLDTGNDPDAGGTQFFSAALGIADGSRAADGTVQRSSHINAADGR